MYGEEVIRKIIIVSSCYGEYIGCLKDHSSRPGIFCSLLLSLYSPQQSLGCVSIYNLLRVKSDSFLPAWHRAAVAAPLLVWLYSNPTFWNDPVKKTDENGFGFFFLVFRRLRALCSFGLVCLGSATLCQWHLQHWSVTTCSIACGKV